MTRPKSLSLSLYGVATAVAEPLTPLWLRARVRRGREDPGRWRERLGVAGEPRPAGRLAWLHGVSVGESLSLLSIAERLRTMRPEASILITSGTVASAELLARRLPVSAVHQYAPVDTPGAVRRFLAHWRPDLAVFVESELWPNLILGAKARGARTALLSARMSARSAEGWRRSPAAAAAVLGAFDLLLARDLDAGARLEGLGARVDGLADLKFGAAPLPVDEAELHRLRVSLGRRPVVLAASTHPDEEALILASIAAIPAVCRPLLIVAPRHPTRGAEITAISEGLGLKAGLRSAGAMLDGAPVHVADTVGELGLWYRLAALAIIGGSLVPEGVGGHNPLEPARLGCPFVTGPYVTGWPVYADLQAAGATQRVAPDALSAWIGRGLSDPAHLALMARRASRFVAEGDAVAEGVADRVIGLLP